MRNKLPNFRFEIGICIHRMVPAHIRTDELKPRRDWHIIGRLEDETPFLLVYFGGNANWYCESYLGDSLRKKILGRFREEVREANPIPSFVTVHDVSDIDKTGLNNGSAAASEIAIPFFHDVWRAGYLNDRDEDYVALSVPFAEKDVAKALGAKWDGERKVWLVKRQADMSQFARWMKDDNGPVSPEQSDSKECRDSSDMPRLSEQSIAENEKILSPAEIKEKILATWVHTDFDPSFKAYCDYYWLTAELNGIRLFTRPQRVMDRPAPYMPYQETDGMGYIFLNKNNQYVWDFDGKPNGQGYQDTIDFVAKRYAVDLSSATWVVDSLEAAEHNQPRP